MRYTESYVKNVKFVNKFIPFFGNVLQLVGKSSTEAFRELVQFINREGTPFKGYIGPKLSIVVDKPDDIKAVLTHCLDKPFVYEFFPSKLGLLTERSSEIWKPSRRLLNPTFNLKTLQSFIPIFNEKTKDFIDEVGKEVGNGAFDILPYASACTFHEIWSTLMGLDIDLKPNEGKEFIHSIEVIFDSIFKRFTRPWLYLDFIYRWTDLYKEEQKNYDKVRTLTNKVFEEQTKQYLDEDNDNGFENLSTNKKRHLPIIPLYVEGKLSEDLVKDQIEAFLIAGYETSSNTVAYTVLVLAMHPQIQEQVFNELRSIFDTPDEQTTYDHIQKMHLLDRVIKETMRLCPTAPFIERTSSTDVQISDCVIPKNTFIVTMFYTLHRRRDIWGDNANDFNPDNFLPENVQSRHPFAYQPFGGGSRNCIGHQYAIFSLKVMLSALLRNYKFNTHLKWSEMEFKMEITLKLESKHMVTVAPRTCQFRKLNNFFAVGSKTSFKYMIKMFAVVALVILVTWALVKYVWKMYRNESYVRNLKCKQPFIPFFGNVLSIMGLTSTEIFNKFVQFATQNETPLKMYFGSKLIVILDKPEDLKAILLSQNCLDKPYVYGFYPCPRGIATEQCGVIWKKSRKLMNPTFNLKMLQSFIPVFNEKVASVVQELKDHVGKSGIDIMPYTNAYSLDTICATVLGLDIDLKSSKGKEFIDSYLSIAQIILKRAAMPWAHFDYIYQWTDLYKQQQKRMPDVRYLINRAFDEQIKNYSPNNNFPKNDQNVTVQNEHQFIGLYMEGKFNEDMMKQQIETMLIGAFETTGSTAAFVVLMLAMHPIIQEQVFDELRSVFDTQDEEATYEHIRKMNLLDRVIKETMRLLPMGPFIERVTTADVPISSCVLPRDVLISISIFTLHRRKDIWGEHANEFNPDNFLPEKVQSRHAFSFLPFSGGPRNCIGYLYAMFSMKVMIALLLRNYQFSTDSKLSDLELKFELTLKLAKKPVITIAQRNW
ncbi:cytochrome P450 4c3-like [Sitodiplosis mosellana]|uniref:cytochrome P450 4c3-like n=1 Tax=Sitodiplosis mosellana TaxID=263140 RepID=UPI002443E0DA|nr:cytochrome P450 4c3-like [Sitodiplosis mosellana]